MKDIRDDILYKLLFEFDLTKSNDGKRKEELEEQLNGYNVKKIKNNFAIDSDDLYLRIDKNTVVIETSRYDLLFKVLSAIENVYNYKFEKLGEGDYLNIEYKFKNDKITISSFEKFIDEVVKISNKDEYTILLQVEIIKIFEDETAIGCKYELAGNTIKINASPINNRLSLQEVIESLVTYIENQVEYLKRDLEDGE